MKNLISIFIVLMVSTSLFAQINQMNIRKTDGSLYTIPISEVDSIYYNEHIFQCGETITDFDGNVYNTVEIFGQCWMKENLNVTHYANGNAILLVEDSASWSELAPNNIDGAYCYYNNDENNEGETYGALYTWAAAMGGYGASSSATPSGVQGICPTGWHIPSDDEWRNLVDSLGGESIAGGELKDTVLWDSPNTGANNSTGFSALPGGIRGYHDSTFEFLGGNSYWWCATETDNMGAWFHYLSYLGPQYGRYPAGKNVAMSVRCLKD